MEQIDVGVPMNGRELNLKVHPDHLRLVGWVFPTLAVVVVPDTVLTYAGKLAFALLTAIITSTVSSLISKRLNAPKGK